MRILFFLAAPILFVACNKEQESSSTWLNAKVVSIADMNCGRPLLNFAQDSAAIRAITGNEWLTYVTKDFPAEYTVVGNDVLVKVRQINPEESFPCITLGPSFPVIVVTDVRRP
ncbi:hypothetical protein EPD60_07595 [Flaviaesturariibacter flavus]|uniref:Uncharacterized protein n=1 Tax=Flaviaesturariibacter flavus TaxID=2502780 RepID=A0A4V2NW66_9BACT|nr:hypothetical protein [Flaviaesturariibacter flavus]TCJ16202.1 hypothetical protein EPD60_07595 [Flaviaesturariibacter flavus]